MVSIKQARVALTALSLAIVTVSALPGGAARAASDAETYHAAVKLTEMCRDRDFSAKEKARLEQAIVNSSGDSSKAKRLAQQSSGERRGHDLFWAKGCEAEEAKSLLALFDRDLAPILQGAQ